MNAIASAGALDNKASGNNIKKTGHSGQVQNFHEIESPAMGRSRGRKLVHNIWTIELLFGRVR